MTIPRRIIVLPYTNGPPARPCTNIRAEEVECLRMQNVKRHLSENDGKEYEDAGNYNNKLENKFIFNAR